MEHTTTTGQESAAETTEPILEIATRILDSTKESVDRAETEALEAARRGGFRQTIVERIGLAVREIMINGVIHGNALIRRRLTRLSGHPAMGAQMAQVTIGPAVP